MDKNFSSLTPEEREALLACADEHAWSEAVLKLKASRGGTYPHDWYEQVIKPGGIITALREKWHKPRALSVGVVLK